MNEISLTHFLLLFTLYFEVARATLWYAYPTSTAIYSDFRSQRNGENGIGE